MIILLKLKFMKENYFFRTYKTTLCICAAELFPGRMSTYQDRPTQYLCEMVNRHRDSRSCYF